MLKNMTRTSDVEIAVADLKFGAGGTVERVMCCTKLYVGKPMPESNMEKVTF
jgi:hypothetical protein